jgi:hypothetical protein
MDRASSADLAAHACVEYLRCRLRLEPRDVYAADTCTLQTLRGRAVAWSRPELMKRCPCAAAIVHPIRAFACGPARSQKGYGVAWHAS